MVGIAIWRIVVAIAASAWGEPRWMSVLSKGTIWNPVNGERSLLRTLNFAITDIHNTLSGNLRLVRRLV